ncbi:MAG: sugar kinase [Planctomycetota bacterium]|nr:sugar kinase [Planctomycetota bacterium]
MPLTIKLPGSCQWDAVALGEVMLRLDPGAGRIRTAREFRVWEGGGEYNVVRGLRRCFGLRTAVVTAVVDSEIGRLLEDLMLQGGVDLSHVQWVPFDGIGRAARVGLNFTEQGFGLRAAVGCSDRAYSAASQMKPGDVDWVRLFRDEGVRWFHSGGIFAALSATTAELTIEAMQAAREAGTIVSYDLNFRASLWKSQGGTPRAVEVNRRIAPLVDVMLGNEEDFTAALGFAVPGMDDHLANLDPANFRRMIGEVLQRYPNFQVVATTLRNAKTATVNDWGAVLYADGQFYEAPLRENLEIYDRIGGGDSFASGLSYALLAGKTPQQAVEYGAAHGALAMTTPGDTSMVTLPEVEAVMQGKGARVVR